ncbi:MAG: hypothetical protein JXR60_06020 [Bacteroidales bacterium]|nr:hypothetical protein [Bacteroidales bacterium]
MSYKAYFTIEKKLKAQGFVGERADLIEQFTDGKKSSLRELTDRQYKAFIIWLTNQASGNSSNTKEDWQKSPANIMRRKVYSLFITKMDYSEDEFNAWLLKYGKFHKPLQEHSEHELVQLTSQAEAVYKSWVKEIHK